MTKTITFNELRRIKDSLPDGSMHRIADELNVTTQTVRNYFGGTNYSFGKIVGSISNRDPMAESVCSTIHRYTIWHFVFWKKKTIRNKPIKQKQD